MLTDRLVPLVLVVLLAVASAGCQLVGDIFQAGVVVGVLVVVLVLGVIFWLVRRLF